VKKIPGLLLFLFALAFSSFAQAQTFSVNAKLVDSTDQQPSYGTTVLVKAFPDSAKVITGTITDSLGNFTLNLPPGTYYIKYVTAGYKAVSSVVVIKNENINLGTILLPRDAQFLKGVDITDKQVRVSQNGDTTSYKADGFKTNPDATAGDLVTKMPGMGTDNGTPTHNGQQVKQVLVDGKPYFGDDPNAALKSIPADMVDQVQVYDQSSDNSRFSGFDDGNSKKTINIVTKKASMNGKFGKVYTGYGTNDRFNAGFTANLFNNDQRLTILGMSNNINQQNFSPQDLFGTMSGSSGGRSMVYRGGGSGGSYSRGGSMSGFMNPNQNGITTTNAFGVNYSDDWGAKIKVTGSYFFNISDNNNTTDLTRNYFASSDSLLYYQENNSGFTRNINHRFNFRFEYNIDSMNALVINPRFTSQFTDYDKTLSGTNYKLENIVQSSTTTDNASLNQGYTFSNNFTFRHRFLKPRRTVTFDLTTTKTLRDGSGSYFADNRFPFDTTQIDQRSTLSSESFSIAPTITWTEPAWKSGQLLFSYSPSWTRNWMDKETNNRAANSELYTERDTALTNRYTNYYITQKGGISYRYSGKKATITFGSDVQFATLTGDQSFPDEGNVVKSFSNILPNAQYNYKFDQASNLRINYRTSTNPPNISQLQRVVDNSNPLQLKTGNPDLVQDYQHTIIAHYGKTNMEKATGFFFFVFANLSDNYVGNSTFTATRDTLLPEGIFLNAGSQLIKPVNLDGYRNARAFITYSYALAKIKCNLGFSMGGGYLRTPALINDKLNYATTYNAGPQFTLSSNISEKLDFTLSYNGNFNLVSNSIQVQSDNNYFTHTASLRFNWMIYKGFVFNTTLDQTFYNGLGAGFNTNYLLWNASLGYKFFNKTLEVKASAFDVLKQNTSVTRTVSETYIEDSRSNVLSQYYMLTLTWNFKKFKKPDTPGQTPAQPGAPAPAPQK
jgi:hypothetical protein